MVSEGTAIVVGADGMARTEKGHYQWLRETMTDETRAQRAIKYINDIAWLLNCDVTLHVGDFVVSLDAEEAVSPFDADDI